MYKYQSKGLYQIMEMPDYIDPYSSILRYSRAIFCWWHIDDKTNEIDDSSKPYDEETCWWVVDTMCNKCHAFYGMDQRYPISICTDCGHIQEE